MRQEKYTQLDDYTILIHWILTLVSDASLRDLPGKRWSDSKELVLDGHIG